MMARLCNIICFVKSRLLVALLNSLTDFATEIHFSRENTDHANVPLVTITSSDNETGNFHIWLRAFMSTNTNNRFAQ